uniref:Retrotransposon Copia-like N-terminal domain-containing protein n=1 Tax=Quercus lobata TaxID=97700 RepID=A0A7N2LAI8_QUELO
MASTTPQDTAQFSHIAHSTTPQDTAQPSHTTHSTTSHSSPAQSPLLLLSHMSNHMSIKLDYTNYIPWKHQLITILEAYSLIEHIEEVLYSVSMPSEEIEKPYYATMTLRWDSQLVFNEAGYIYIQDAVKTYKTYNLTREDPGSREIFYHMARIDHDGVFRL